MPFDSIKRTKALAFLVFFPNYVIDFNFQGKHSKTAFKIYAFPKLPLFTLFYVEVIQALIVWIRSDDKMKLLPIISKIFLFFFLFVIIMQSPQILYISILHELSH